MNNRKSIKVSPAVKVEIEGLKRKLNLKNESEVIAYLKVFYDQKRDIMTVTQHEKALRVVKDLQNQIIIL